MGFVDWDFATPGPALRDLAFVAFSRVPLVARDVAAAADFAISSAGNLLTGLAWAVAFGVQTIRGVGIAAMDAAVNALLQRNVPRAFVGRVFGSLYGAIGVAAALAYVLGGLLLDATNPRVTRSSSPAVVGFWPRCSQRPPSAGRPRSTDGRVHGRRAVTPPIPLTFVLYGDARRRDDEMRRALALPAVALASVLALAGCSTNAPNSASGSKFKDPTTDFGVSRTEIVLGALTDKSSPFSEVGTGVLQGQQLWIKETNAEGGICQRKITLKIGDYQDNAVQANTQYTALEPKVLGFMQIVGSSATAALSQRMIDNETTVVALSKSSELLSNPYVIIPAATYDVEMINGLSYLMEQGKIHDGDTIGHIWLDGDYGANGLRGAQYFAQRHHLNLREAKVGTESTMRDVVAAFAAKPRAKAIALSTTPDQAAAAAAANQEVRLGVPMIGNSPVFTPRLLTRPAPRALNNLSVVASSVPFSSPVPKAQHVAEAYRQAGHQELPNSGVPYGYAIGRIWGQLLTRACINGDLSRAGIQEALRQLTTITTDNLVADLSFAKPGSPAAREAYIGISDPAAPGGIREVRPLFASPDARSYVAPHQTGD
jgi:ABC-type branched-subunit amino acid transport system substrate-binding protein